MGVTREPLTPELNEALHEGLAIPAHPLALTAGRKLDERRQRALTRYYLASGAGGIAVAVHSTQFEIRNPEIGLLEPVLRLAAAEVERAGVDRPFLKVAGRIGGREQAVRESQLAALRCYDTRLLGLGRLGPFIGA
ncbi:dihydrodipicolinate synthetase, partial [Paenibacillus riograndensis]